MRTAVFITSGIGNSIFLLPLIKAVAGETKPILLARSPFKSERVFDGYEEELFSEKVNLFSIADSLKLIKYVFRPLDAVYVDFFSANRSNLFVAYLISKSIVINRVPKNLPSFIKSKIRFVYPIVGLHEAQQYVRFHDSKIQLSESMLRLTPKKNHVKIKKPYATLQIGAGNNLTPWKIWPVEFWQQTIQKWTEIYPSLTLVLLGDEHDKLLGDRMMRLSSNVLNLIDKTKMVDLPGLLSDAEFHVGGDSGLLQIAGTVGTKSVAIIGGSDPEIFGWHKINSEKHKIVQHKLYCHPCYRWILPNKSRVNNAKDCPDFKCIRSIEPSEVMAAIAQIYSPQNG